MARKSLHEHLTGKSTPRPEPVAVPLTPLAGRLVSALTQLAKEYDELEMIVGGFVRMHRRDPWTDDEIRSTLTQVREYIGIILQADEAPQQSTAEQLA